MTESRTGPERTAARTGWWVALLCGGGLVTLAALLIPWHQLPGFDPAPVDPRRYFTPAELQRGEEVAIVFRVNAWIRIGVGLLVLSLLGFTAAGRALVDRLPGGRLARSIEAVLLVVGVGALASLPFDLRAQRHALAVGLSRQSWDAWWIDQATSLLVALVVTAIPVLLLGVLVRRFPRRWPAVAAIGAGTLVLLGSLLYPVVVEPLFNSFRSMPAGELRSQIERLADREGVQLDDVLIADASRRTTTLNAYVSGIGGTRRVVVYDNLVESQPQGQVLSVIAHELAHARHQDVLVGTVLAALAAGAGVGLLGGLSGMSRARSARSGRGLAFDLADPGSIPRLLALVAVSTALSTPVSGLMSRAVEGRADADALAATGDPESFVSLQQALALRSRADITPPALNQWWFGTHPTTLQRIERAERFAREGVAPTE